MIPELGGQWTIALQLTGREYRSRTHSVVLSCWFEEGIRVRGSLFSDRDQDIVAPILCIPHTTLRRVMVSRDPRMKPLLENAS